MDTNICAYCGESFCNAGWPHVEGDLNRGVMKIEFFCSEEHKALFFSSKDLQEM